MQPIRVIIVDDVKNTRESIRRILSFNSDFEVIGEANCGSEAIRLTELLRPDLVLMDISMPDIDGIKTAELLSFRVPSTAIIMMSVQNDSEYMTKAMLAGAKAYIVKPFTGTELTSTLLKVSQQESRKRELMGSPATPLPQTNTHSPKIISLFSTKGGVGKTTVAVNLAVELAKAKSSKVLLVDLSLQFGDIASFLNLVPKRTITDLAHSGSFKYDDIRFHILTHSSGVEILAASLRPEYAELVMPDQVRQILEEIKAQYDYILCDNSSRFDEITLTNLEIADEVWLIVGMDIPAIKNTKLCLEVIYNLEYTQKIKLVLNKFDRKIGFLIKDIESSLGMKINYIIPDEEQLTTLLNKGVPFVDALPRSAPALEIRKMAKDLTENTLTKIEPEKDKVKSTRFQKILGFGR